MLKSLLMVWIMTFDLGHTEQAYQDFSGTRWVSEISLHMNLHCRCRVPIYQVHDIQPFIRRQAPASVSAL